MKTSNINYNLRLCGKHLHSKHSSKSIIALKSSVIKRKLRLYDKHLLNFVDSEMGNAISANLIAVT